MSSSATEWTDTYLKQACKGIAARIRKHGVALPGTAAGGPPSKRGRHASHPQKKKKQPKEKKGAGSPPARLTAAGPTAEGSKGAVTQQELSPYLQLGGWPCAGEGSVIKLGV